MIDGTHYFECACGSSEHTIRFILNKEDKELYTEVYLNQWRPLWKRLLVGIKYMLGYKCKYGEWDCWVMSADDAERLRDMCNEFITHKQT